MALGPDLSNDSCLFEEDGRLVAVGWVEKHEDTGFAIGIVHRERRGRGLGSELVDRSEERLRTLGVGRIHAVTLAPDVAAEPLLTGRGYREVRRFWEMTIELGDDPPPAPQLPNGLRIEQFSSNQARAFHDALEEAFAEHWEWHPKPFDEWLERRQGQHRDEHGPVWFVVRDGDELAAVTRNDADVAGGGYVGAIGVRPAWRGKGLAKALLQRTFAEFWRRGKTRVTLDVDSQNETGAVRLYESVGMVVEACGVAFEKANE